MLAKMKQIWCFFLFILLTNEVHSKFDLNQCLAKDSISCLQIQFYRKVRELMNEKTIGLSNELCLVQENGSRMGKSLELLELEEKVENATDVISRQEAIERFLGRKVRDLVMERTVRWDVGQTIRNLLGYLPQNIKAKFTNYATEARGKGKKLLRFLVPLLIGLKLTMIGTSTISYLVIAVLAKKALLASLISLIFSGYIGLKKLLDTKQPVYNDLPTYHPWTPPVSTPNLNYDADYSESQKLAYKSQIPS